MLIVDLLLAVRILFRLLKMVSGSGGGATLNKVLARWPQCTLFFSSGIFLEIVKPR